MVDSDEGIEKHIGGNVYTYEKDGINIHRYGAHIFHTSDKEVWDYINRFAEFNNYINSPIANYKGEIYNMPFNMNTFSKMWGIRTPDEAKAIIEEQRKEVTGPIDNLEKQAISLVGRDIFEKLVKGYTEKQWGRDCSQLPPEIIRRLPVRYTYDNNYFNDRYQGIPIGGYTKIIEKLLEGTENGTSTGQWLIESSIQGLLMNTSTIVLALCSTGASGSKMNGMIRTTTKVSPL